MNEIDKREYLKQISLICITDFISFFRYIPSFSEDINPYDK